MEVIFWPTSRGDLPVKKFIESIRDPVVQAKITKNLKHLGEQGLRLTHTDKLEKLESVEEIWELKTKVKRMEFRILLTVIEGEAWLLHGFQKKDQKTRKRDIDVACQRREQLNAGGRD